MKLGNTYFKCGLFTVLREAFELRQTIKNEILYTISARAKSWSQIRLRDIKIPEPEPTKKASAPQHCLKGRGTQFYDFLLNFFSFSFAVPVVPLQAQAVTEYFTKVGSRNAIKLNPVILPKTNMLMNICQV